jgi:hypothetical protein
MASIIVATLQWIYLHFEKYLIVNWGSKWPGLQNQANIFHLYNWACLLLHHIHSSTSFDKSRLKMEINLIFPCWNWWWLFCWNFEISSVLHSQEIVPVLETAQSCEDIQDKQTLHSEFQWKWRSYKAHLTLLQKKVKDVKCIQKYHEMTGNTQSEQWTGTNGRNFNRQNLIWA